MKHLQFVRILFLLFFILSGYHSLSAQTNDTIFVAFWNMENLFDVVDDPVKDDAEFLPDGVKEWTAERLDKKLYNMARLIQSMNNENGPDVLGMCEVENKEVVQQMVDKFLNNKNYVVVHDDSPDNRGIDVTLIFDDDKFDLISSEGLLIELPDKYPTRNILHATLKTNNADTLHLFINHWPSRRGGENESKKNRIAAASVLRHKADKLFKNNADSRLIIMGDFNDEPGNTSILDTLNAAAFICENGEEPNDADFANPSLFNLAHQNYNEGNGSYKYRDDWNMLDQIIISNKMVQDYYCGSFTIYQPDFIVTHSGKFAGTPFPTYGGNRYLGGYSDHFPVFAKFILKGK